MKEVKFHSGTLHGVYRCGKRREIEAKMPRIEDSKVPDVTGLILSGIRNFGSDSAQIRQIASEQSGYDEDSIRIPYGKLNATKRKFVVETICGKLDGSITWPVSDVVNTFYDFVEMPTKLTRDLQVRSDIRDISRYLKCETRKPASIGHPVVNLAGCDFVAEPDLVFRGLEDVVIGRHKEKRKWVNDTEVYEVLEAVRIFPTKPQISEGSELEDVGTGRRLELYVLLKAMEDWYHQTPRLGDKVLLKASYYYLQKNREKDENYSADFFGKGGNVVSIQTRPEDISAMDEMYMPQIEAYVHGQEVSADKCESCRYYALCNFREADTPVAEVEKPVSNTLPVLSRDQKEAAETLEGNIRVVATAGSGKTTAMAYRIMNLLKSGVAPEKIGCFTFTNTGADEMVDRIGRFCKIEGVEADVSKVTISTIHAFGDSLLKKYYNLLGYKEPPVLINEIQRTKILESILSSNPPVKGFEEEYKRFYMNMYHAKGILPLMKDYFEAIDKGISIADFMDTFELKDESVAKAIGRMYVQYVKEKKESCLIDHNDQERGILQLLKVKPDLFEEIGIEHISVDEFQDTSNIQFEIIDAMRKAPAVKSLFIVGDDDQSIYGFRDADVGLIKDFQKLINEDVRDIQLSENRRSTQEIVRFADAVINNNQGRIPKHPVSVNNVGAPVTVTSFEDKDSEQEYIVDEVARLVGEGYNSNEIAILTATNSELLSYAEKLAERGIKSVSINPEPVLSNSNVVATVSLAKFFHDRAEIDGICYLNAREHGKALEDTDIVEKLKSLLNDAKKGVPRFLELITALDPDGKDEIFQKFLEDTLTAKRTAVENGNLEELITYILDFSRFGSKETERKEKAYNGVVLSTMHSAKGKEWDVVFCSVTKLHTRETRQEDVPEKNRLLFVACTRAKKELYVTGVENISTRSKDDKNLFLAECEDIYMLNKLAS